MQAPACPVCGEPQRTVTKYNSHLKQRHPEMYDTAKLEEPEPAQSPTRQPNLSTTSTDRAIDSAIPAAAPAARPTATPTVRPTVTPIPRPAAPIAQPAASTARPAAVPTTVAASASPIVTPAATTTATSAAASTFSSSAAPTVSSATISTTPVATPVTAPIATPVTAPTAPTATTVPTTAPLGAPNAQPASTSGFSASAPAFEPSIAEEELSEQTSQLSVEERTKHIQNLLHTFEVEVKLDDAQADINSPLYSTTKFEDLGLSHELLQGVFAMGFKKPSKIQERALPLLIRDGENGKPRDLIAQSQSGTGKTAAFVLCMLSRVNAANNTTQALCIAPARELAKQIGDVATRMAQFTKIRIGYALKEEELTGTEHVVIGTPGSVIHNLQKKKINPSTIRVFVLDEADNLLEVQGMQAQCMDIHRILSRFSPQVALFSATFPQSVQDFAFKLVKSRNMLTLKKEELSVKSIHQFFMKVNSLEEKFQLVGRLYNLLTISSSIIFCNRIDVAEKLKYQMTQDGYTVSLLHGKLLADERDRVMEEFRKGQSKVLISTNVLSRGIDVLQISLVINFDLPFHHMTRDPDFETYLHRIGRTGRFGRTGSAINFVEPQQIHALKQISQFFNQPIDELASDEDSLEKMQAKFD